MYLVSIPDSLGESSDTIQWIPVDVVAEIVVYLIETKVSPSAPAIATILHLLNSRSMSWKSLQPVIVQSMEQIMGHSVNILQAHAMQHGDDSIVALSNSLLAVKLLGSLRASFSETKTKHWQIRRALQSKRLESLPPVQGSWLNKWIVEWEMYRQLKIKRELRHR